MSKPQITVSLLEPGSLGTEVLYNTDHIKNVRRLKVKGAMNGDDWGRIKMMSTLLELDLSEAQFTEIPANQFKWRVLPAKQTAYEDRDRCEQERYSFQQNLGMFVVRVKKASLFKNIKIRFNSLFKRDWVIVD